MFAPPSVAGRFILVDGVAIAILHNRSGATARSSATLFGNYRLGADIFAYGYHDASIITGIGGAISFSEQVPWQGLREFLVTNEADCMRARSATGNEEFVFTCDGFTYAEHGVVLRRWLRVIA